ncbi:alpha/beta hydrolase [Streptomyces nitrosporeus]|uniref:Alpha/beta hydrolase n=1 Tax=Streptomyces nitrosporeus TaxID=28894 RepID=A0A5J6F5Z5_9ACTN|nr:alpha/beta hydrolase [Streptomyces nitrosporeus]QEU71377.1 alpha/beta hydrolase [Streptomyces nitrosporeus]GGY98352.1 lipase [Streptomyces nitrosporeus]
MPAPPTIHRHPGRIALLAVLLALAGALAAPAAPTAAATGAAAPGRPAAVTGPVPAVRSAVNPVIFVHGQHGSAQQWESQAKRFSSNGYRDDQLYVHEWDTSAATDDHAVESLEHLVDSVRARTGADRVDLLAHSRGTRVAHAYLADPARAAEVAGYVNLDGRSADAPPGGVPTLAIWSSLQPEGSIGGAVNVYEPDAAHTQSATSAESFAHVYAFLRGRPPLTTRVLPEPPDRVRISGRVAHFPQNTGLAGRLELWRLDPATGARRGLLPLRVVRTGADGAFGPLGVDGRGHYELAFVRPGERTNHFYTEPFERSDHFVRLLVSPPGGVADRIDACPGRTALTVVRAKEWWSGTADDDRLSIGGTDVLNPAVSPRLRQILGLFAFDKDCDGQSHLDAALPPFDRVPFLTATDLSLPATAQADGSVAVTQTPRGADGVRETLTVRNWSADRHTVSVQFKDYVDIPSALTGG